MTEDDSTLKARASAALLAQLAPGDLFRVVGRGPKARDGSAELVLVPVEEAQLSPPTQIERAAQAIRKALAELEAEAPEAADSPEATS